MDVYHYERIRAEAGAWGEFEQKRWTGAESLWEPWNWMQFWEGKPLLWQHLRAEGAKRP